jgi:hypothetical protein
MSHPDFPKPTRVDSCGDIEFNDADIVVFARVHPDICCFLEQAFDAMSKRSKKKRRR